MALSKCHIGISPSGQKMGLWDQSQCHVQSIVGIDPNVMKSLRYVVTWINPKPHLF